VDSSAGLATSLGHVSERVQSDSGPEPSVGAALEATHEGLERLENLVGSVEDRLKPVLRVEEGKRGLLAEADSVHAPFISIIGSHNARLELVIGRLQDILGRVQL
jgi:hypothetical protein